MLTANTQVHPQAAVLTTTLSDEEVVLLHTQTSYYYTLNATGAQIWHAISNRHTLGEISHSLSTVYALTQAEADAAVYPLLQELIAEKLVEVLPTPAV
jgi:Coenzyme PQQ synthesis protein D (PqqD)